MFRLPEGRLSTFVQVSNMTELLIGCSCIAGLGIAAVAALAWFARHLLYRIWCYIRLQRRREFVIANGIHVKAVVVQANMTLFAPSDEDDPAQVILTFDNNLPDAVSFLRGVAERMAALKDTQGSSRAFAYRCRPNSLEAGGSMSPM
jgi:hypothetical protein